MSAEPFEAGESMSRLTRAARLAARGLGALIALALAAPVFSAEWVPAVVELSDGARIEGRVQLTDDSLVILDEAQARRYTVRVAEMAKIETIIERQSMEEKWLFRESGLDDKVYTGEQYPVREYLTRITFHDARQIEGHIMPRALYVERGGQRQRFILRRKDEGQPGQMLGSLVYVRTIVFQAEGAGARGTIEGALHLPEGESLQKVLAVNRDKLFSIEALIDPAAGTFRLTDCTEGTYDLLVVTDRAIYVSFSREREPGAARLNGAKVEEVQSWVNQLRDFFQTQAIVYAAGDSERVFALVCKERHGGTTSAEAQYIRAYDVWAMSKPHEEWQIERRMFVTRAASDKPMPAAPRLTIAPALAGHAVSAAAPDLRLDIVLGRDSETPPPATAAGGESHGN